MKEPSRTRGEKKHQILFVCNSPDNGGGAKVLCQIVKHIDLDAFEPILYLHKKGFQSGLQDREKRAEYVIDPNLWSPDRTPELADLDLGKRLIKMPSLAAMATRCVVNMVDAVRKRGVELIFCNGGFPIFAGTLAAAVAGVPAIAHLLRTYTKNGPEPRILDMLSASPVVRKVLSVSSASVEYFTLSKGKTAIRYTGIDLSEFRSEEVEPALRSGFDIPPGTLLVGTGGRFVHHKGFHLLIEAAPFILRARPDAMFVFIGKCEGTEYGSELRRLVKETGLESKFIFTGFVPSMAAFMKDLDVFVLPSIRDAAPLTAFEGLAMGLPTAASAVGDIPMIIPDGECGLIFRPQDAAGLAAAVSTLLSDAEMRRRLGEAGKERARKLYDTAAWVRCLEQDILQAIEGA